MGDFILWVFKYKMVDLFFKLLKKFWGFIDHTILILQGSNIGGRILSVRENPQFLCKSQYKIWIFILNKCLNKYDVMIKLCRFPW